MSAKEKYINALKRACNEMKLDYFPQAEASELLYKVISLENIYLPLSLVESRYDPTISMPSKERDINAILAMLDKKIKFLEEELANENSLKLGTKAQIVPKKSEVDKVTNRILIEADPGSGKTTFCKRLVLALLNNEEAFFTKYYNENNINFNTEELPVLLSCKYISDLSIKDLNTLDFNTIIYKLCVCDFGNYLSEISEKDFLSFVSDNKTQNLCLILDGWDELLDIEKALFFQNRLEEYARNNPSNSIVITSRFSYVAPGQGRICNKRFRISPFSDDDIRAFCKNWFGTILSSNLDQYTSFEMITNQILNSKDYQVRHMMHNPLELSLLLTVCKNEGLLPENRSVLFEKLVDLHIYWNTYKRKGKLSQKTKRVLLAYIATQFTKNRIVYCDKSFLLKNITQAISDLIYVFSEDVSNIDTNIIAEELSHTGILTKTFEGARYSFSETKFGSHRLMQEYLTAFAIYAQYTDAEYRKKSVLEILEDKYDQTQWHEVIIFIALMKNARLRQDIIDRLIVKCTEDKDKDYFYTNLLFSFVLQKAEIDDHDKHKIYDLIFQNQITDRQISYIIDLVNNKSRNARDFSSHIADKYEKSIEGNHLLDYAYPYAVIKASEKMEEGISPLDCSYRLMLSSTEKDIFAGIVLLDILAWCKYSNISNELVSPYNTYKLSPNMIVRLKALSKNNRYSLEAIKCIKESIVAGFVSSNSFFDTSAFKEASVNLVHKEKQLFNEIVLSLSPVFSPRFQESSDIDCEIKNTYLQRLNDEIKNEAYDNIVFTFCICVAIGCFTQNEKNETWSRIRKIYKTNYGEIGKARFNQLDEQYFNILRTKFFSHFKIPKKQKMGDEMWVLIKKTDSFAKYRYEGDNTVMCIEFPNGEICNEANAFLEDQISNSIVTNNNLAYLLRRNELKEIQLINDCTTKLTPMQLLGNGAREFDAFSTVNTALVISEIYRNTTGNYSAGKDYLSQALDFMSNHPVFWLDVSHWWISLAIEQKEYEGLVVMAWLYSLGLLEITRIRDDALSKILSVLNKYRYDEEDFTRLYKDIRDHIGS